MNLAVGERFLRDPELVKPVQNVTESDAGGRVRQLPDQPGAPIQRQQLDRCCQRGGRQGVKRRSAANTITAPRLFAYAVPGDVWPEGRVLTPDVGGCARTVEVGDEVVRQMRMGPGTSQGK